MRLFRRRPAPEPPLSTPEATTDRPLITAVGPVERRVAEPWPTAGALDRPAPSPLAQPAPPVVPADVITAVPWHTGGDAATMAAVVPEERGQLEPEVDESTSLDPVDVEGPSVTPVEGPRVVLDTGQVVALDRPVLVGRDPAPRTGYEDARLIGIDDGGRSVSKTHLVVAVVDGRVMGMDMFSTNGTSTGSAAVGWTSRPGGEQFEIVPGTVVRFGQRTLQVAW